MTSCGQPAELSEARMRIWKCDRCGKECHPFTTQDGLFFEDPPHEELTDYDLCEECYYEVIDFLRHPPKWRTFDNAPEIGKKIIRWAPDTDETIVEIWDAEHQKKWMGGCYRMYKWKYWENITKGK